MKVAIAVLALCMLLAGCSGVALQRTAYNIGQAWDCARAADNTQLEVNRRAACNDGFRADAQSWDDYRKARAEALNAND